MSKSLFYTGLISIPIIIILYFSYCYTDLIRQIFSLGLNFNHEGISIYGVKIYKEQIKEVHWISPEFHAKKMKIIIIIQQDNAFDLFHFEIPININYQGIIKWFNNNNINLFFYQDINFSELFRKLMMKKSDNIELNNDPNLIALIERYKINPIIKKFFLNKNKTGLRPVN